ncbi:MAG: hypothetical protein CMM49_02820 [Rhodospirillaceae bacterium]|nr:hypothetical protein [Rhodospirillaceae bacterium]
MNNQTISINALSKSYKIGSKKIDVLKNLDIKINKGEIVAVMGPSGSGKSTLLHLIGILDRPDSGNINLFGKTINDMSEVQKSRFRLKNIGFVYQFHNLMFDFTALENTMIPQMIAGFSKKKSKKESLRILDNLGLKNRTNHKPSEMSGGEQQRCAFARAIINQPNLLIADEPTGNLDQKTAENVFKIIKEIIYEKKLTAIIATHSEYISNQVDRVIKLVNGSIYE